MPRGRLRGADFTRLQDQWAFANRRPFPTFVGGGGGLESLASGAIASRHASVTDGDIELVGIDTNTGQPGVISTAGWAQVPGSPQDAGDTTLSVWWHRYTTGDPLPTIDDSGDHQVAYIFGFRGCRTSGDPFDATAGGTEAASTTVTLPSVTTTSWNTLIVGFASITRDLNVTDLDVSPASNNFGANWSAPNVTMVRVHGRISAIGAGGGFVMAIGMKAEPGPTGNPVGAQATSLAKAMLTIALR